MLQKKCFDIVFDLLIATFVPAFNIKLVNGNNYLPKLPNAEIRKALSDEQKDVFRSMPQNTAFFAGQPFGMLGMRARGRGRPLERELDFVPESTYQQSDTGKEDR